MSVVMVTGANGQLGKCLQWLAPTNAHTWIFLNREALNLSHLENLPQKTAVLLDQHAPNFFIHAAAYTQVDLAESEPTKAVAINQTATALLAKACAKRGIVFIYLSTDFVFSSNTTSAAPKSPQASIAPKGVYAQSKAAGEKAVAAAAGPYYIVRTSWLFSHFGHNFVKTIVKMAKENPILTVVADQFGSPTSALDLSRALLLLLTPNTTPYGIHHFSNKGTVHWANFAREIISQYGVNTKVKNTSTKAFGAPAPRPTFSALQTTITRPRLWKEALAEVITLIKSNEV